MCGIAGLFVTKGGAAEMLDHIVTDMVQTLSHRGPDDDGIWTNNDSGVALGHRRLSIVDLSPAGHQPMLSSCKRYVLVFNGEIYNHLSIRDELQRSSPAPSWKGHSDTETLLYGFAVWGVKQTLRKTVGMFAFALWDKDEQRLILGRDRFGEKPLYYGWIGARGSQAFVFGSELKALKACPGFDNPVDRDALALYLRYCYVPAPYSIYQDIFKLQPGSVLSIDRKQLVHKKVAIEHYWKLHEAFAAGLQKPIYDKEKAVKALDETLRQAVGQQMVADVPLGAFLSGGIDSSTIVALMQTQSSRPIDTFTVGFDEAGFDESAHAREVARHLGTNHHEMRVSASEAREVIPFLPRLYDEPFADSSQIPTWFVCRAARQRVTVALSGDAGDELFGGYNRYLWSRRIWKRIGWIPPFLRNVAAGTMQMMPAEVLDGFGRTLPGSMGIVRLGDKVHKLSQRLHGAESLDDLYRHLVVDWPDDAVLVRGAQNTSTMLDNRELARGIGLAEERMMLWDSLTYLPDDILTKVDRAAMGVSLETRVPFLDHRVAELAWRLPLDMKIRNGEGKWALRQVLCRYVPKELIERPKAGFSIPIGQWLRGPLRDWAEALLSKQRLEKEGYFYSQTVREAWQQHVSGRYDFTGRLWSILMFQVWFEHNCMSL
jgi:asparagine synthase (glutamine-hydrolysing)